MDVNAKRDNSRIKEIEIMDCTLRDGEQTNGVSFLPHEKLMIARMLLHDINVDRIEVASARVSEGEKDAVARICRYAKTIGKLDSVEVLGFVDNNKSVDWIAECGGHVINLLAKGSYKHCTQQLKMSPEEHLAHIKQTIDYALSKNFTVNLYLEDWSSGMRDSRDYLFMMMDELVKLPIKRFLLPDTLGILNPLQCVEYMRLMVRRYPNTHFDFHAHNDYDLAVSNSLAAVLSGAKGLHVTVNGLGERCGNAPLASVQVILKDMFEAKTNIKEDRLNDISRLVEGYSGIAVAPNTPVVGDNVFTQVAGVHADGDNKDKLYCNDLVPERFGRHREYALGKNSGKANIVQNLNELGLELTPEQTKAVTKRITELGDRKQLVTQDDLPYIVSDVLKHSAPEDKVKLVSYMVSTSYGLKPIASVKVEIDGKEYEDQSTGDGQYDAFVKALRNIYKVKLGKTFPLLDNYQVSIPPGGRTDALVQTVITWREGDRICRGNILAVVLGAAGDGERFARERGCDLPVQAVVHTEVALCGCGRKAADDGLRVEIRNLKLLLELLDLLLDELLGDLLFQIVESACRCVHGQAGEQPHDQNETQRQREHALFHPLSSFVVMYVYNRNTYLSKIYHMPGKACNGDRRKNVLIVTFCCICVNKMCIFSRPCAHDPLQKRGTSCILAV